MDPPKEQDPLARYPFLRDGALSDDLKKFLVEKSIQSEAAAWNNQFEVRKWRWSTPLAIALTGVITIGANFAVDYWKARQKQQIEDQSGDSDAKRKAAAAEREFEYRIVERELTQDKPEKERAKVLLFLVRSGVLNGLNANELKQMAEDALGNKGSVGVPSLGVVRQDFAARRTFCKAVTDVDGQVSDDWIKANLVEVAIPQLTKFIPTGKIQFNKVAAKALQEAFADIEQRGLLDRLMSWDGGFVVRPTRPGIPISTHSCGIAFDINARWNPYNAPTPAQGAAGSVAELVPVFEKHGFAWGGTSTPRDAMHFEFAIAAEN